MYATDSGTDMRSEILSAQLWFPSLPGAEARYPGYCQCHQCKCEIQRPAGMGSRGRYKGLIYSFISLISLSFLEMNIDSPININNTAIIEIGNN